MDSVAPIKEIRIKNTQEWFDNEIAEAIKLERNISESLKNQIFRKTIIFMLKQNIIPRN